MNDSSDEPSRGIDKNQAFVIGLNLAKDFKFAIEVENCSVRPIFGEEIGVIMWVLKEESKEPPREEIIEWLKSVFGDPFALAQSFYPAHLKPGKEKGNFISDFDSRTSDLIVSLPLLQNESFEICNLYSLATTSLKSYL